MTIGIFRTIRRAAGEGREQQIIQTIVNSIARMSGSWTDPKQFSRMPGEIYLTHDIRNVVIHVF
jgi:hypothetical protein